MQPDPTLEQLRQLYRQALVTLGGADEVFADEMPLPVLSGMYGARLRQEVMRLSYWPTVCAAATAVLQSLPLEPAVSDLFEQLKPLTLAHDRAFEDTTLIGFMTDRSMRINGNPYNRTLLQLSFRVTSVWTTSHSNFMLVRDAAQLLSLVEMMVASHGAGIEDRYERMVRPGEVRRIESYLQLLTQVRELTAHLPAVAQPGATLEWLRDHMEHQVSGWQLGITGEIKQVG